MPSSRRIASRLLGSASTLALAASFACTTPAPLIEDNILLPLAPMAALQPSDSDLATRDLVRAALLTDREAMDRSIAMLHDLAETEAEAESEPDLVRRIPISLDLRNATLDDPTAYRHACASLKDRRDNDPRLNSRLEECAEDDFLSLAQRRVNDSRETLWAETYNAVADPLSRSLLSGGILTPYYLANSVASYLARINERDAFGVQMRQALDHRERYLAHFPDSEEVPKVTRQVERGRAKLHHEEARKLSFQAKVAINNENPRIAYVLAKRALELDPENKTAAKLAKRAHDTVVAERIDRLRSQSVAFSKVSLEDATRATGLLLARDDLGSFGLSLLRSDDYEDVGLYIVATALIERGDERTGWDHMQDLSGRNPDDSPMARHARALVRDPAQNPQGSFERVNATQRNAKIRWHFFGPFFQGPRYRRLPMPVAWLLDAPLLINTFLFTPVRFIFSPISQQPDFKRPVAIAAYRYLDRRPEGEYKDDMARWLYKYESSQKNWTGALRMADHIPDFETEERTKLVEKAAEQQIAAAGKNERRDRKSSTLRHAAREFPDSQAGHQAGLAAREHREGATAQNIRMTRGFLIENPQVTGPRALGLRRDLIDGENANGELHPRGVSFIGGRYLEFEFLAESGDEDDPPKKVRQKVSRERLTRLVAVLDDTARRNYRVDPDADLAADPRRDLFIERASLGLTDEPDPRATAQSTYVFESARERFGMVRGRESVLPFDLVVRGDLSSAGIAAFPRWRKPKETPDAFLYR